MAIPEDNLEKADIIDPTIYTELGDDDMIIQYMRLVDRMNYFDIIGLFGDDLGDINIESAFRGLVVRSMYKTAVALLYRKTEGSVYHMQVISSNVPQEIKDLYLPVSQILAKYPNESEDFRDDARILFSVN